MKSSPVWKPYQMPCPKTRLAISQLIIMGFEIGFQTEAGATLYMKDRGLFVQFEEVGVTTWAYNLERSHWGNDIDKAMKHIINELNEFKEITCED